MEGEAIKEAQYLLFNLIGGSKDINFLESLATAHCMK